MFGFAKRKVASCLCIFLFLLSVSVQAKEYAVHIRGSTTLLPIAQKVAEAYMADNKDAKIVISGGGTAHGYKAVMDGTAEIAMASSLIPDDINNERQLKNIELKSTLLGYATIVTVVHPANRITNLSLGQLKDIFTGRIKNWKYVGGIDAPITVYVGPPTGGITDTWKSLILGNDDTYTPAGIVLNNAERFQKIAGEPNSITFLTLDKSNYTSVKILTINNIAPGSQTVSDGTYALRAPLMLITRAEVCKETQAFIRYFSASEQADNFGEMVKLVVNQGDKNNE